MSTKLISKKDQMFDWLFEEIRMAEETGVPVAVDGKVYSLEDAEMLYCVMEDYDYMKSYVDDGSGKVARIDFDHIKSV